MASKKASLLNKYKSNIAQTINKKKELEQQKSGKGDPRFFKPEVDKEYKVRIVPVESGDSFPLVYFHYTQIPGNNSLVCLHKNYNAKCPICEAASGYWNKFKETDDPQYKELFKRFVSQKNPRFFSPVLVRGEEELGVRWWAYSQTVYNKIIGLLDDPDYGDITDLYEGIDLKVSVVKEEGKQYPSTDVMPVRKNSPLADSDELMLTILETTPDFDELHERKSAKELQKIMDMFEDELTSINNEPVSESRYGSNNAQDLDDTIAELQAEQQ